MKQFIRETMTLRRTAAFLLLGAFILHAIVSALLAPGLLTSIVASAALVQLVLTAIARVNDIEEMSLRWHVRRVGLVAVVGGCAQVLWQIWTTDYAPSWTAVLLLTGWSLAWLTTPNQPPWWRLMGEPDRRRAPREPQT